MKPEYIVVHHSESGDSITRNWDEIRRYHIKDRGWSDIGYHFGIELIGDKYEILKGRPEDQPGAHALGFNSKSIGVCCVGNFDKAEMPAEQMKVLVILLKTLMVKYSIQARNVIGHRETYAMLNKPLEKTCPGLKVDLDKLRVAVG